MVLPMKIQVFALLLLPMLLASCGAENNTAVVPSVEISTNGSLQGSGEDDTDDIKKYSGNSDAGGF